MKIVNHNTYDSLGLIKKAIENKDYEERRNFNSTKKVKLLSPCRAFKKIDNKNFKTFATLTTLIKKEKKLTPYQQVEILRKEEREVMKKKSYKKKFCFLIEKNNPFLKTMSVTDYSNHKNRNFHSIESIMHSSSYTDKIKKLNEISQKNTVLPLLKIKKEKTTNEKGSQINFPLFIYAYEMANAAEIYKNGTI